MSTNAEQRLQQQVDELMIRLAASEEARKEVVRERDELRRKLQWQPIETAPKDKTRIIIFSEMHGVREAKFYRETSEGTEWYDNMVGGGPLTWFYDVSYWMPLPSSPQPHKD